MSTQAQAPAHARAAAVVPDVLAAIHEVLRRHKVTEEEWFGALRFLEEVARADELVLLSDVTRCSVLVDELSHEGEGDEVTASDVEGPLYVEDPPWREPPVKLYDEYEGMGDGDVLFVAGTVTSADGRPLPGAVIDVWQTGPSGGYDIWDGRQPEYNFRGRMRAAEDGTYEFRSMVPKPYTVPTEGPVGRYLEAVGQHPWRPAHIHFKVSADGHRDLVTQVFFPDDPYLEDDTIGAVKDALVRPLERHEGGREDVEGPYVTCAFDIRLRPAR
jgi:protocatechuate 3,4-dioxygenase beta subunit